MHPREPLTKKAFAAIFAYANHKADTRLGGYLMNHYMCKWTVEAERMPRQRLYDYLEMHGYRWLANFGVWENKKKPPQLIGGSTVEKAEGETE
jgi:hypothetical protein